MHGKPVQGVFRHVVVTGSRVISCQVIRTARSARAWAVPAVSAGFGHRFTPDSPTPPPAAFPEPRTARSRVGETAVRVRRSPPRTQASGAVAHRGRSTAARAADYSP